MSGIRIVEFLGGPLWKFIDVVKDAVSDEGVDVCVGVGISFAVGVEAGVGGAVSCFFDGVRVIGVVIGAAFSFSFFLFVECFSAIFFVACLVGEACVDC